MEPYDWIINTFDATKAAIYTDAGVFVVVPESARARAKAALLRIASKVPEAQTT